MAIQTPPLRLRQLALAFDALRTPLVVWGARHPAFGWLVRSKGVRLSVLCHAHALLALVLVLACPSLLLVLGPLILGVPHVASDIRYLVLRYPASSGWRALTLCFCAALLALRVVETGFLGNAWFARSEVALLVLFVLAAASATGSPQRWTRNAKLTASATICLGALCMLEPVRFRMIFAHAHNLVGIGLWYLLYARRAGMSATPLLTVAGTALLLVVFGGHAQVAFPEWLGLHVETARAWLAPGVADPHATGLVLSYTFLQSVHYAVWLIFIPQAAAPGRGTTTFASSLFTLWRDFGPIPLVLVAFALLGVVAFALVDPLQTQAVYLFVTPFHGYLELAVLAHWLSHRQPGSRAEVGTFSIPLRP